MTLMRMPIFKALFLVLLSAQLTSCIKTWDCTCNVYDSNNNLIESSTIPLQASSKAEAEADCNGWEDTIAGQTIICEITK